MFLHDAQKLDNDLGAGSDEDLALPGFFGVVDGVERIIEDTRFDHFEILSSMVGVEVSRVVRERSELAFTSFERKECPSDSRVLQPMLHDLRCR